MVTTPTQIITRPSCSVVCQLLISGEAGAVEQG
jgi:hypothetical protein